MAENNISSRRTKHIWIIYRFVTEWITKGLFKVYYINTKENLADFMTKVPKDVNYIAQSSLLFKNLATVLSEVVCYNTEFDDDTPHKLLRAVQRVAGIKVRDAWGQVA